MKKFGILAASLVAVSALSGSVASALDYKVGALEIDNPWSRAVPKGAKVAVGYMTIKNTGTEPDRLVAVLDIIVILLPNSLSTKGS
jgi:copper(I)-binding protein